MNVDLDTSGSKLKHIPAVTNLGTAPDIDDKKLLPKVGSSTI